ncbi:MAG: M20 family peptidase [Bacteroidetes bacterium]|nr:M20 family peptidase [Bacteroidota bacterium]
MIKKTVKLLGGILLLLIIVLLVQTFRFKSKQPPISAPISFKMDTASIKNLCDAINYQTVSFDDTSLIDKNQFTLFTKFLSERYPLVDSILLPQKINSSLLYTWKGKNNNIKPIILIAHMDVVPATNTSDNKWKEDPFSGIVKDGYIWGRGTRDDKISVISILEAVNSLLKENYSPERTIYIGFGHDEEIGGLNGAKKIAEHLEKQGIKAEYVLDEGLLVTKNLVPGISKKVALIGTSEKGYVSLELSAHIDGGHSSMPGKKTAIGTLSEAIAKLEKNQAPAKICKPVEEFFEYVGPEMPFIQRMVFANTWLLKNIVIGIFEKTNSGNSLVRTTMAATIFDAGTKDNILPAEAKATINFRVLPGETISEVVNRTKRIIGDESVSITIKGQQNEPMPSSTADSPSFKIIAQSISQTFDSTLVAPSLFIAASDSKHYLNVAENIYRFLPLVTTGEELKQIHGENERISIDNYQKCILFYQQLIKNSNVMEVN